MNFPDYNEQNLVIMNKILLKIQIFSYFEQKKNSWKIVGRKFFI